MELERVLSRISKGEEMIVEVDGYGEVMKMKDQFARNSLSKSYRDFGGVYIVGGRYLFAAAADCSANLVSMVDINFTDEFQRRKNEFLESNKSTKIEEINVDFRELDLYEKLTNVDTSLLYEVLLHQENYVSIIEKVISRTNLSIHVAQPVLMESCFLVPSSATLLQFWPDELKAEFQKGSWWPVEPRVNQFETNYWMWGHTRTHLNDIFKGYGWQVEQEIVVPNVCGEKWDFLFAKYAPRT